MKVEVTGCEDCPFYNAYYGGETITGETDSGSDCCNHPVAPTDNNGQMLEIKHSKGYEPITPDWCPLKQDSITIEMKQK